MKNEIPFVTSRGADPECFIKDTETGQIVSAIDVIKHDKYKPIDLGDDVTIYYDNAMLEFTVKPAFSKQEFINSFKDAFDKINLWLEKQYGGKYELVIQAAHYFEENQLEHPEAKRVGCNPEYTCYPDPMAIVPPDFSGTLRSAGGHVAIGREGFKKLKKTDIMMDFDSKINLVKLLDYYLAIPFILIDNDNTSLERKKLYGRTCSSHRPKDFGAEYRVLSNYWISSPELVGLIYDLSELAVEKLTSNNFNELFQKIDYNMINAAIQENNKELADEILDVVELPKPLRIRLNQLKNIKSWDLYEEWNLNKSLNLSLN